MTTQQMQNFLTPVVDFVRRLIPARFRGDIPVVPVLRLSGAIGMSTPLRAV